MAVQADTTFLDPNRIRPDAWCRSDVALAAVKAANWLFGYLRQNVLHEDFRDLGGGGDGVWQGTGSTEDTTLTTYVERVNGFYISGAIPDNNNQLTVTTVAYADTADGKVRVELVNAAGATIDTIDSTHAFGSTTVVTTAASGGALDGDTTYRVKVSLYAGASGYIKLYALSIDEVKIVAGSLP